MTSKLLHKGAHEAQDEVESILSQAYATFQAQLTSPYHISTATASQRSPLTQALLYAILIQPKESTSGTSYLDHLTTITTDAYASFVALLFRLVNDSYHKLLEQTRHQVLWLLRQLIGFNALEVDNLCVLLLRQVVGGDLSGNNIWLANQLLDVFNSNLSWVTGNHGLLTTAVFTFLRLLPDHSMSKVSAINELRLAEIKFCCSMLREHFHDCMGIGRDLVRLLHDVALVPEFEGIWRDLLSNPGSFRAPAFNDIAQLYSVRTPNRYIQSRLTPDMEAQIKFMLTHVRMGNQRRYQTWFSQRFFTTPESESLVCDVIRYVCCVHHPSNQILQSDILPRWALIGWLLKCCKSNHVEANAKLALLYDWLFFVPKADNIMNIEPAILVMVHSIPKYSEMTNALLEFLFLLMDHYDPLRKEIIQRGVAASFDILVGKGVVRSLEPLSAAPAVSASLREKLSQQFPAYCRLEGGEVYKVKPAAMNQAGKNLLPALAPAPAGREEPPEADISGRRQLAEDKGEALQVDAANDSPSRKKRRVSGPYDELQSHVEKFSKALGSQSQESAIKALENALPCLNTQERAEKFASQITEITSKGTTYQLFSVLISTPTSKAEGDETMSITSTLFRLYVGSCFQHMRTMLLYWHREGFPVGTRLLCYVARLAEELEMKDHVAGLLKSDATTKTEVLVASTESERAVKPGKSQDNGKRQSRMEQKNLQQACHAAVSEAFRAYEEFLRATVTCSATTTAPVEEHLRDALMKDLRTCLLWNVTRLQRVLPWVFRYLPNLTVGSEELIKLTVCVLAPPDVLRMELKLALGEVAVIGGQENAAKLIKSSLTWDTLDQQCFWRLLAAEVQANGSTTRLEIVKICTSAGVLNPEVDVEAVSGVLCLLRSSPPSAELSSALLASPLALSSLTLATFSSWFFVFFQELVTSLKQVSEETSQSSSPSLDLLLNHFDEFDVGKSLEDGKKRQAGEVRQLLLSLCQD